MGNTCQTDKHLNPSLSIEKPAKKDAIDDASKTNSQLSTFQQKQSPLPNHPKMKPLLGQYFDNDPDKLLKMQRIKHYKKFWHLLASDGRYSVPTNPKRALKKINYVSHLYFTPSSCYDNSKRRLKALVGSLKRFHRILSLKLYTWQITERSVNDFYQIFKNLNSLQSLHLNIRIDRQGNSQEDFLSISQALKKCQGLRHFSVKLESSNAMTENLFGPLLSILKRKVKLETLSIDISGCSQRARTVLMNTMKKLKQPKLASIYLKLDKTLTSQNVFANFEYVAPSLRSLYLHLIWTEAGGKPAFPDEMLALSESLKKLKNLTELYVKIHSQDLLFALKSTKPAFDDLLSTNKLPLKSHIEAFSFVDREINRQDFLNFYLQLTSSNCIPEIQVCLNREKIYSMKGFCFETSQKCPPGLSIAYVCPVNPSEATEYNKEFCSFLDQVNSSSALTLDFAHNFKIESPVLKKIFGCIEKFHSLKSFGLDFSGCKTIDQDWIQRLFQFIMTLPQSLSSLNLKFSRCVKMTPQDVQFFIDSLQNLKFLKNLTVLCLDLDYVLQITNENLSQLGKEIKNLITLTDLNLSFKGSPLLDDEGVIEFLENLKPASDLETLQVNFEGCKNVKKFTKLKKLDQSQIRNSPMGNLRKNV